jgi:hypothetical protein
MHHTFAYQLLIGAVANTDVPAVPDDIAEIISSHFRFSEQVNLIAGWVGSPTLSRARINSPHIRQVAPAYVRPVAQATKPGSLPNIPYWHLRDLGLPPREEIRLEATASPGTTEQLAAAFCAATMIESAPDGDPIALYVSSTTTAVALAWSTLTLTWQDALQDGLYAVVGAEMMSANGIAFRMIFDKQFYRPGGFSINTLGQQSHPPQVFGGWGIWGRFRPTRLPAIQVFAGAADAAHEGYVHVLRIGP